MNLTRILRLPIKIQDAIRKGGFSTHSAIYLLGIKDPEKQEALFDLAMQRQLSWLQLRNEIKKVRKKERKKESGFLEINPVLAEMKQNLEEILGTRVEVINRRRGKQLGLIIDFFSQKELEGFIKRVLDFWREPPSLGRAKSD